MKTIKRIAVATDFSDNARIAYKYGKALAKLMNVEFTLIHIYASPLGLQSGNSADLNLSIDERAKKTLTRLRRFANDKSVNCAVHIGSPAEKLTELSQNGLFDLLIIGVRGERGLFEKLFGSVALSLMKHAFCPVLLLPKSAKIPESISNIVYATSELSSDNDGISTITDWAQTLNATIHFVHVNRPGYNDKMTDISALMADSNAKYIVKELEYISVRGAIDSYCEKQPIDIMVSMTHNYSLWNSFFHNSITESLAWNNPMPLLVLHKKSE